MVGYFILKTDCQAKNRISYFFDGYDLRLSEPKTLVLQTVSMLRKSLVRNL